MNNLIVCFLSGAEQELVSGSSDKLVIVWKKTASLDCTVSYLFIITFCAKLLGQEKTRSNCLRHFWAWPSENLGLVHEVWSKCIVGDNFLSKTIQSFTLPHKLTLRPGPGCSKPD